MITAALVVALLAPAADPTAIAHREEMVLLDDRAVDLQASQTVLNGVQNEIATRTGVKVKRLSELIGGLSAAEQKQMAGCKLPSCLGPYGKKLNADVVVTVRAQKVEGTFVVTITRVGAMAPVPNAEEALLARTEREVASVALEGAAKLFPKFDKPADKQKTHGPMPTRDTLAEPAPTPAPTK